MVVLPSYSFCLIWKSALVQVSVRILDCCSDPLGWKEQLLHSASVEKSILKDSTTVLKNVKDVNKLLSLIVDLGKGMMCK